MQTDSKKFTVEDLIQLAVNYKLKSLRVGSTEIIPDWDVQKEAKEERAALEAQEITSKLFDVSEDELLADPYHGLEEALKDADTSKKP